jgi:hypothetical protein
VCVLVLVKGVTFFVFFARQKKAALAPGAWPKSKPRGGGSAVSKGGENKIAPPRGAKRASFGMGKNLLFFCLRSQPKLSRPIWDREGPGTSLPGSLRLIRPIGSMRLGCHGHRKLPSKFVQYVSEPPFRRLEDTPSKLKASLQCYLLYYLLASCVRVAVPPGAWPATRFEP